VDGIPNGVGHCEHVFTGSPSAAAGNISSVLSVRPDSDELKNGSNYFKLEEISKNPTTV